MDFEKLLTKSRISARCINTSYCNMLTDFIEILYSWLSPITYENITCFRRNTLEKGSQCCLFSFQALNIRQNKKQFRYHNTFKRMRRNIHQNLVQIYLNA